MITAQTLTLESPLPSAVAVGFFDGVHIGHQAVIKRASEFKSDGLATCVFSFSTSLAAPAAKRGALLLQTPSLKQKTLKAIGADILLTPDFKNFMGLSPKQFAEDILVKGLGARVVCCGYDYHFGKGASAGADELAALLKPFGADLIKVGAVLQGGSPISSTRIRAALNAGDIGEANAMLGRPFAIDFVVEHGKTLGRKLGFPTANQHIPAGFATPRFGVYATGVTINGKKYAAVTNVGVKPTVGSDCVSAESYILDWDGDIYGQNIETEFYTFLRPEQKFESLEALKTAIAENAVQAREIFSQTQPARETL